MLTFQAGRIMLYNDLFSFDAFLTYLIPLTIAPAFITASIYLCLARIIHILDPALRHNRLQPMTYTKIFVTFDVISLILQGAGGGVAATADDDKSASDLGINIMIAGLAFQVFSLVCFIVLCSDFAIRLCRGKRTSQWKSLFKRFSKDSDLVEHNEISDYQSIKNSRMFKGLIAALVVSVVLILTRSVYRLIELQDGFDGELANDETLFFILEGPMILLSCILLTVFHPALAMKGIWSMKQFRSRMTQASSKQIMMDSAGNI